MNETKPFVILLIASMFISVTARAAEPSPADVIEAMRKAYSDLVSYSDSGVVETTISMAGQKQVLKKPFVIVFKKPDFIRIEWTSSFGGMKDPHVLWSNKKGTFTYNQLINQVRKEQSLAQATASLAGVSGGSARTVPSMLLNLTKDPQFSDLADLKHDGTETVGGTACRKISGNRRGQPVILSIGETDFLLRKITVSTQFGDNVEVHENIKANAEIQDTSASFTPPKDAEQVERFRYQKLKETAQPKPEGDGKPAP
jgi:outer membrane lipoprotein-sorting protein